MERYVVTGAQGFVGRYLVRHLLNRFPTSTILGIGRSPGQNSTFLHTLTCENQPIQAFLPLELRDFSPDRYSYVACDLTSRRIDNLIRDFHPSAVVHLACSLRGISEDIAYENNVRSTQGLLESILLSGVKLRVLLVTSSGGVYGKQETLPIAESAVVQPVDRYAQSKFASEILARAFACDTGTPIAIVRIFNVLGPGQAELYFAGRMAGQIAGILKGQSRPVIRTGSLAATRDFLDVRDVCSALATILEHHMAGICNVGSGIETKVGDLLQAFLQYAYIQDKVEIQARANHDLIPRHFANIDLLRSMGFSPQRPLHQSAQEMVDYRTRLIL